MIQADIRILHRGRDLQAPRETGPRPGGVPVHQQADHVAEVLLGPRQPVLQAEEIGAHILRRAGDEAQQARQFAQHAHLALAGGPALLALRPAQLLEQAHDAARLGGHVEAAEPGQLHHLAGRKAAHHRVAIGPARLQGRQNGADMLVEEEHRRDDDVRLRDIRLAARQRDLVRGPVLGRMDDEAQARHLAAQRLRGTVGRARQVAVHRDEHDAHRGHFSGRSALWHRRASRG